LYTEEGEGVVVNYVDPDPNPDLVCFLTKFIFFGADFELCFSPVLSLVFAKIVV
jgi:hypothetical protein